MRYALGVEYDGSGFLGWQRLSKPGGAREAASPLEANSVQEALELALSSVAAEPIATICAGRTDAGVHGQCQVVHFDTQVQRSPRGWVLGSTSRLPPGIGALWCVDVADDFSARFSARARRYRYRILNRQVRPTLQRQFLGWEHHALDAAAMHAAAQALRGENDFSSFRSAECQATHPMRNLHQISVRREGEEVIVDVQANAFLHHMVRNIVGSLLLVGRGERPVEWIAELLAAKDRTLAGPTAPAAGLLFVGPLYDAKWNLPESVTLHA